MSLRIVFAAALVFAAWGPTTRAHAQEPRPAAPDTLAPADTTETLEELERRLSEELGRADTAYAQPAAQPGGQSRSALNPDLSAIGEFLIDLSPDEATLEGGDRFQVREVEVGIQGAVDPYFRYDAFVGIHGDVVELEEGYATTLGLPAGLQVKLGKFHLPFGKVNLTHRPELHTIDYPLYVQEYFGEEGFSSAGVWGSVIGAPLGFFQEISVVAANGAEAEEHGEEEAHAALTPAQDEEEEAEGKDLLEDLGDRLFVGHLKNSIDLSEAANLELGGSIATGEDEESGRTSLYGIDAIYRWKPPQMAKYRSAILQVEVAWRDPEEGDTRLGAFAFGQWQLSRRSYVGARWDYVELAAHEEDVIPEELQLEVEEPTSLQAGQIILRYFPTEFSQLRVVYERQVPDEGEALDRVLFQATVALGPHRPHPF
jgi:hypothetical protein